MHSHGMWCAQKQSLNLAENLLAQSHGLMVVYSISCRYVSSLFRLDVCLLLLLMVSIFP